MKHRPAAGRFISEDSNEGALYNPQSLNLYTYCENNPLRYVDPNGYEVVCEMEGGIIEEENSDILNNEDLFNIIYNLVDYYFNSLVINKNNDYYTSGIGITLLDGEVTGTTLYLGW